MGQIRVKIGHIRIDNIRKLSHIKSVDTFLVTDTTWIPNYICRCQSVLEWSNREVVSPVSFGINCKRPKVITKGSFTLIDIYESVQRVRFLITPSPLSQSIL